jgi:hypothetical protein
MNSWFRGTTIVLLLSVAALVAPGDALAELPVPSSGAAFYELTENLSLRALKAGRRKATSELLGFAVVGTPLCPSDLAMGASYCIINATGSDNINLTTGLGNFGGTFTIAVQGDNPVDSPELVIGRGHFSGKMDFSPAVVNGVPLGTVVGTLVVNGGQSAPFTGVFRLPVGTMSNAYYLGLDGTFQSVADNERATGWPTVKFEISF